MMSGVCSKIEWVGHDVAREYTKLNICNYWDKWVISLSTEILNKKKSFRNPRVG